MSPVVEPSGGGYDGVEIPDGLYEVRCTKAEERQLANDKYGNTDKVQLSLAGKTPDNEPFTVEPLMNLRWGEKSTLFSYAIAFGIDADPDEAFDTDELVGKKAMAFIVTAEAVGSWPRVRSIDPIKAGKTASAPSTKATEPSGKGPAVLLPDGTVDWNVFWKEIKRLGGTRASVAAQFEDDLGKLTSMDGVDVAVWLDELRMVAMN